MLPADVCSTTVLPVIVPPLAVMPPLAISVSVPVVDDMLAALEMLPAVEVTVKLPFTVELPSDNPPELLSLMSAVPPVFMNIDPPEEVSKGVPDEPMLPVPEMRFIPDVVVVNVEAPDLVIVPDPLAFMVRSPPDP